METNQEYYFHIYKKIYIYKNYKIYIIKYIYKNI